MHPEAHQSPANLRGAALLSNTTVCEASRILQSGQWGRQVSALYILDLLRLIDASILHDRLFCLPARLSGDVDRLRLRKSLIENGVIQQFLDTSDQGLIGQALISALADVKRYKHVPGFAEYRTLVSRELGLTSPESILYEGDGEKDNRGFYSVVTTNAGSFEEAAYKLIEAVATLYSYRDESESSTVALRAMYYVFAAEHYGLPYWASANVWAIARKFPNYLTRSARGKIYDHLSDALRGATEDLAREFEGTVTFIPPFSAIVLDRAESPDAIPGELLALREEYSHFRVAMSELEHEREQAKSIKARLKAVDRLARLCKEVSEPFKTPVSVTLQSSLKVVPDMAQVAVSPVDPTAWTKLLLDQPAEWLASWYRRRPVAKLVKLAEQVASLESYVRLLDKHFGSETAAEVKRRSVDLLRTDLDV